jgi:hypothetical protein
MITSPGQMEGWLQRQLLAGKEVSRVVHDRITSIPGLPGSGSNQIQEALRGVFKRLPALGTYVPSGKWTYQDGLQSETLDCWVLCAAANSREVGAPLRGDNQDPGAWDLVEYVRKAVTGKAPDENISDCRPLTWRLLWCNDQTAVCAVELEISIVRPVVRPDQTEWTGGTY